MKKTLLATAIPAMIFASSASAIELYADEVNTFSVGGHISAGLIGSDEGSTGVNSVSPRINIGATRDLGNGFVANTLVEFGVNMDGGENTFWTRLGYVGLTHDVYGNVTVGTQWAPTYDVNGLADMPIAFANENLYNNDMSQLATGRGDNMVSYRNSFDLAENIALNFGLGVQGAQTAELENNAKDRYSARYQAALSFDFSDFTVGVTHNSGDVNYATEAKKETATVTKIAAKYGSYGQGLYVAAVYGESEFAYRPDGLAPKSSDVEALVAYAFENSVNVSLNFEEVTNDTTNQTELSQTAVQVEYNFAPSVVGYAGYQFDLGTDISTKKDNVWMIGARVYL
ncbi:outer membrane protein N [Psychromonas marina]|uniref:Outer membrane protein N n=1 Tax=Psychromonas marina TaxID=88364 RepID=A0ABQ6E3C5_9GAMM|nr:porin [Psychromonas marina]GLS91695.1 outer membrane protein N [Psychromonas marina]